MSDLKLFGKPVIFSPDPVAEEPLVMGIPATLPRHALKLTRLENGQWLISATDPKGELLLQALVATAQQAAKEDES